MQHPWWRYVLQICLWFIVTSWVMGCVSKNRLKSNSKKKSKTLSHPASTFFIGCFGFVFFAGISILSNVYANKTTSIWTTLTFVTFALIATIVIADYFLARHEISESGINFGKMTGTRGYIQWSDLESVEFSSVMQWFKLKSNDGQIAHISSMLSGLPEFARLIIKNAPSTAISADTRVVLEETAKGSLPQLW